MNEAYKITKLLTEHIEKLDSHSARESNKGEHWKWNTPVKNEFIAFGECARKDIAKRILYFLLKEAVADCGETPFIVYIEPYEKVKGERDISGFSYSGSLIDFFKQYIPDGDWLQLEKKALSPTKNEELSLGLSKPNDKDFKIGF